MPVRKLCLSLLVIATCLLFAPLSLANPLEEDPAPPSASPDTSRVANAYRVDQQAWTRNGLPASSQAYMDEKPFSRMAFSANLSPLGIGMTTATNIKPYMNLRITGNTFGHTVNNISTNGFNLNASLSLTSVGVSLDLYPFERRGFRITPGLLAYNGNRITASSTVAEGTAITLNDQTYYSANTNAAIGETPLSGSASLNLNSNRQAFTITTGWGNHVHPKKHISFPFEIGAAFIGSPAVRMNLNGWACADAALQYCASVTGSNPFAAQFQTALKAQQAKWDSDLNPLRTFPIISVGFAYSFGVRK